MCKKQIINDLKRISAELNGIQRQLYGTDANSSTLQKAEELIDGFIILERGEN